MLYTEILLNPRYLKAGFSTQALNIKKTHSLELRKVACLASVVSLHILKHGSVCYACDNTLLRLYNEHSENFGVPTISKRTVSNILSNAVSKGVLTRATYFDKQIQERKRTIEFNLQGLKNTFAGVFNYSFQAAKRFLHKQELHNGRSVVDNASKASHSETYKQASNDQSCVTRSNDLSKESNKNKGLPSDSFFCKFFGRDANDAKSLQMAAKEGRITASGALKLIKIHAVHGFELASKFKRYLNWVIAKDHAANKKIVNGLTQVYGGSPQQAILKSNEELTAWFDSDPMNAFRGELRYNISGVLYVRWFAD